MPATADQITILVRTRYLPDQSAPEQNRFIFAYTITINNNADEWVRLMYRYWQITDANDRLHEVRGRGVVGETPVIEAGDTYQYTSGTLLETAVGTMQGSYDMVSASGAHFSAPVPPFSLALPGALH